MHKKTIMDCGLTVISEFRPGFPSLALSLTLRGGAAAERMRENGVHHMIEHMVFKGSRRYSLMDIAAISDRLGGSLNAFTGREITQYYLKVLDEQAESALDLILDMALRSTLRASEVRRERQVILQEIRESEDSPESHAFDTFFTRIYGMRGYGLPIAGTRESVARMDKEFLVNWYAEHYQPRNLILATSGNMRHERLLDLIAGFLKKSGHASPARLKPVSCDFSAVRTGLRNASLQQSYVIMAFPGMGAAHPERYAFSMVNEILGGGVSSRLFQSVREKHGIAYTVSSFHESFRHGGIHMVYAIMEPGQVPAYLKLVTREIGELKSHGIRNGELERARDHLKASLVLDLEENLNRMRFQVNRELFGIRESGIEALVKRVNDVEPIHLQRILDRYLDPRNAALFVYGPDEPEKYSDFSFGG